MSNHRKARGAETVRILLTPLRTIWPYAEAVGAGSPGRDVTGTPGQAIEVKARRDFNPLAWIRQACSHIRTEGEIPVVIFRPDGMGEATVLDWPVCLRLRDYLRLSAAAGYGTPPADEYDGDPA